MRVPMSMAMVMVMVMVMPPGIGKVIVMGMVVVTMIVMCHRDSLP